MSDPDLQKRLQGTWQLVSCVIRFEDGEFLDQFGHDPSGFLIYSPDGYVSAVLGAKNYPTIATSDAGEATVAKLAGGAPQFIAYCGRFTVDDETHTVTHAIQVSLLPDWIGRSEVRTIRFAGEQIVLVTASQTLGDGRRFKVEITWRRPAP
jgi:hypothetical protein